MNEDQLLILGRRALRCLRWEWMPGMAWERKPSGAPDDGGDWGRTTDGAECGPEGSIPLLSDPATVGCLLARVREVWPKAPATTNYHGMYDPGGGQYHRWTVSYCVGWRWDQAHGDTEAEALVAALEAAGTQEGEE